MNMVDQLPENIDVTYSKSDDVGDSKVVSKVVESVLKEDFTKNDYSESQFEDEESVTPRVSKVKVNIDVKGSCDLSLLAQLTVLTSLTCK
ncbi:hypothetical protein Hanom_Chr15g01400431 [Helianthus anomalus]